MNSVEFDPNNVLAAEKKIPSGVPVTMVNLVTFHSQAHYDDASQPPCSGAEAYMKRYAPAFNEVAEAEGVIGIKVVFVGVSRR